MIDGIDVSYYQGDIDWPEVAKIKRFAIVRSGDGGFLDPLFEQNIRGAVAAGLHVEIYHYLRFVLDASGHAELLMRRLEEAKGWGAAPRLWLDWEDTSAASKALDVEARQWWLYGLVNAIYSAEIPIGHYSAAGWWNPYMGGSDQCVHDPRWVAQYPFYNGACQSDPTAAGFQPTLPNGWDDWLIWQYTSKGHCPGIEGYVDLNVAQDSFLKEENMKPPLYQVEGRPEVYALSPGGTELEHILDQHSFVNRLGYKDEDVQILPPHDPIWNLPVKFLGVPPKLR